MTKNQILTAIYIDKTHPQKNNECRISIRITFNRKRKYYSTPYSLTNYEFLTEILGKELSKEEKKESNKPQLKKAKHEYKEIALELQAYENKAAKIIRDLPVFTFELFEKHFFTNRIVNNTINNAFDYYINSLKLNNQVGTAVSYGCSKISLDKFIPGIRFTDVTPEFLRKYERWMLENGKSITTIGIYLRQLRTIFNNAIADELIPKEIYPFGKKRYEIPTGNNIKKSLPLSDIALIYNYKVKKNTAIARSKDYWLFMYLCNGMNMKDVCLLKYKNVKDNVIEFERAKTIRTKRKVEPIRVALTADVKRIISKYGNKDTHPTNYIFPVLTKDLTAERERQLIQQITQLVNDHMKLIAKKLGIENKVTTYAARHSFATILQRSGVSTSFISEALGHSNVKTTQNYLGGFEDAAKLETAKILTDFKKIKK